MATKPKAAAKDEPEPPVEVTDHSAPNHDWRNPAATFAADDHCPNAELARLARR
jgi:hypothetical protein